LTSQICFRNIYT